MSSKIYLYYTRNDNSNVQNLFNIPSLIYIYREFVEYIFSRWHIHHYRNENAAPSLLIPSIEQIYIFLCELEPEFTGTLFASI